MSSIKEGKVADIVEWIIHLEDGVYRGETRHAPYGTHLPRYVMLPDETIILIKNWTSSSPWIVMDYEVIQKPTEYIKLVASSNKPNLTHE